MRPIFIMMIVLLYTFCYFDQLVFEQIRVQANAKKAITYKEKLIGIELNVMLNL